MQPFRNFPEGGAHTLRGRALQRRLRCKTAVSSRVAVSERTGNTSDLNPVGRARGILCSCDTGRWPSTTRDCAGGMRRKPQFLSAAGFAGVIPGPQGRACSFLGPLCHLLSPLPSSHRRALRGECPLGPLCPWRVQERGHLREPAHRWLPLRVPSRRVRAALLRGDHPEFPAAVLRHLPGPQAALPLHRLPHVSAAPAGPTQHSVATAQGTGGVVSMHPSS